MNAIDARRVQTRAIMLILLATLFFSLMDVSVKALVPRIGVLPSLWARYAGQMAVVILLILPRIHLVVRTKYLGLNIARSFMLMGATSFFFSALGLIPLTDAAALMSINPVLITLGAAVFLGESLGIRRITGIVVALAGALIVIRPGSDVFSLAALLPLAAATCYSGYALLTRKVGANEDPWTSLFYTALVGTVVFSVLVPFAWQPLDAVSLMIMAGLSVFGMVGQMFLIRAFSAGEAAMLAPYAYSGIILATFWSMVLFDEWPDVWTIIGALVIIGAGLYVWHRETRARS